MTEGSADTDGEDGGLVWRPGDVILDLYEVLEVIEGGGMGLVYRVRHRGWDMDLAVRAPRPELASSPAQLRDFESEVEGWVNLAPHPHTVSCAYLRRLDGVPHVFAEWVDGGSLADWVRDRRLYEGGPRAALERIFDVAIQFAWGLEHAHAHGLIHQDVKPANVMLTREGVVKVTDFASWGGMTPAYCSPEQAAGAQQERVRLTGATDVWSWALSVLELFVGRRPCDFGQAAGDALAALVHGGQPDPQIPAMPDLLAVLLSHWFAAQPADRPATMSGAADILLDVYEATFGAPYPRARPERTGLLADGLSNQALSLFDLGQPERAQALCEQALHADPHHVHTIYNRGLERWRRAQITDQQLVAALETAHAGDAEDFTRGYLLGRVHLERGDAEAALGVLSEAARLAPADAGIKEALGLAQREAATGRSTTLLGHEERVTAAALTADGRLALTGCVDGSMRMWELHSGRVVCELPTQESEVSSVALSVDGDRAVSAAETGFVRAWDVQTGSCLHTLGTGVRRPAIALSGDGRVVVSVTSGGGALQAWELPSGRCIRTIDCDGVQAVAVSGDGLRALSGGEDGKLRVWELATGNCLRTVTADTGPVVGASVAVSHDGLHAVSGTIRRAVRLWELPSGRCLCTFAGDWALALSADARLALTSSSNGTGRLWELRSGRCQRTFRHPAAAWKGALSADGRVALSYGGDGAASVWSLRPGIRAPWSYTRPRPVVELAHDAAVVHDGLRRATHLIDRGEPAAAIAELRRARSVAGYERNRELLDRWQQAGRQGRRRCLREGWQLHDLATRATTGGLALSADGRLALRGSHVHELGTGRVLHTLEGHEGRIHSLAVSPDGLLAVSGGESADRSAVRVQVWELRTGRCLRVLEYQGDRSIIGSAAATPDGRLVLTDRGQAAMVLWDAETGSMLHVLGHIWSSRVAALSADGRLGLSADRLGTIFVWDLQSGNCLSTLHAHDGSAESVFLSADGRFAVESVALSADGRFAVSGGSDCAIRLWELETARCLRTLTGHTAGVHSLALSADSHLLISGSFDGTVRVWELDWEYDFPEPVDWDERARPYLETFLATHALIHPGSSLTGEDHERFVVTLERVGFGWLCRDRVEAELERMWADHRSRSDKRRWRA